jgi:hypothetical protein
MVDILRPSRVLNVGDASNNQSAVAAGSGLALVAMLSAEQAWKDQQADLNRREKKLHEKTAVYHSTRDLCRQERDELVEERENFRYERTRERQKKRLQDWRRKQEIKIRDVAEEGLTLNKRFELALERQALAEKQVQQLLEREQNAKKEAEVYFQKWQEAQRVADKKLAPQSETAAEAADAIKEQRSSEKSCTACGYSAGAKQQYLTVRGSSEEMFQYIFVDNNVRDAKGKALSKGRMAAQISHVSVKAAQYFLGCENPGKMRDYALPPADHDTEEKEKHLQRFDMKTVICKTKNGVALDKIREVLETHNLRYVLWTEAPEVVDVAVAVEPMRDEDYTKEARDAMKKLTSLY